MVYFLSGILIISSLLNRKSNKIFILFLIFLWLLFGWSYGNADYKIHYIRYINYDMSYVKGSTEILYSNLMHIFNKFNFTYQEFLIAIAAIILIIYAKFIKKYTDNTNYVLLLYFIFPFCMDVVQLRFSIASMVVYIALMNLLEDKKYSTVKFICCVLIAANFHYGVLAILIVLMAKYFKKEQVIYFVVVFNVIMLLFIGIVNKITIVGDSNFINKLNLVLKYSEEYSLWENAKTYIRMLVFAVGYYIFNGIVLNKLKNEETSNDLILKIQRVELIQRINIAILSIMPFIVYSLNLYRVQFLLSILNYITLSYYFVDKEKKRKYVYSKSNILFVLSTILYAFLNLYLLVLSNNNINSVFWALFNNNLFF